MNNKSIVILGGGSAGWMTANILAYSFKNKPVSIQLIESDTIPKVGVGEGSTPALKVFFDKLKVPEAEWMPACNATYKCGISFKNWSTQFGFDEYYHPFASDLDQQSLANFKRNAEARRQGFNVESHPNRFFLSAYLSKYKLAPIAKTQLPFNVFYGYHFDAELLGKFLKNRALNQGVEHQVDTISATEKDADGNIQSLKTNSGQTITADLFVDCSGFASVLSQKQLETPYKSYSSVLLNDSAIAFPTQISNKLPSQTLSTALKHGWSWKIPLSNRFGNGYVYSSQHCTPEDAEKELRSQLGMLDSDVSARHLKMKVGRVEKSWNKNVLAVGLSQGFIEPLEATALLLIQQTASLFAHYFLEGDYSDKYKDTFNQTVNDQFDGTRDYIVAHYLTNSRKDSDYWKDARNIRNHASDRLNAVFDCWENGGDFENEVRAQGLDQFYPISSWYCLFAGMGLFANPKDLKKPRINKKQYEMKSVDAFYKSCLPHYTDHKDLLSHLYDLNPTQAIHGASSK